MRKLWRDLQIMLLRFSIDRAIRRHDKLVIASRPVNVPRTKEELDRLTKSLEDDVRDASVVDMWWN